MMKLISQEYEVLGYKGPIPNGFKLQWIDVYGNYLRVKFEKREDIPQSTATAVTSLFHYLNEFGTVVLKHTEVFHL